MQFYLGHDEREDIAWHVAKHSIERHASKPVQVYPNSRHLLPAGMYTRQTEKRDGILYDVISDAPMSTDFAISRFFVPHLQGSGWAMFADCDILVTRDIYDIMHHAKGDKAIYVVKHNHVPTQVSKMDGQVQTTYSRKNWSSVMLWNLDHPAHNRLSLDMLNTVPGRDLHAFCWLEDDEIGALPRTWNWLEGVYPLVNPPPALIHYTHGGPWFEGMEDVAFSELWIRERDGLLDIQ